MGMLKKILKIILFIFVALLLLDVGIWVGFRIFDYYKSYPIRKMARSVEELQKQIDLAYQNDVYGGKTPEETFDMYIAALKKGDLELASKYFVVSGQGEELDYLKGRTPNQLQDYVQKLDGLNKKWEPNVKSSNFVFKVYSALFDGKYIRVQFSYNEFTKVWKIDFL